MNRRLVYVTIVGAGHYGKDLVAPKYKNNKFCKIKAVISPHVKREVLSKSALATVPLYRTVDEWYGNTGSVLPTHVFDLCVHYDALRDLVVKLVKIGARNFVFPKP
ncbi:MAG: hypothetical protein HY361_05790, partial [Candidatus Aenigmarchaeota archaeon]|nr:hypothetical protein [Candidatus Aenigmarchaeota archaeon]